MFWTLPSLQVILLQAVFHLAIYTCIPPIERTDDWKPYSGDSEEPYSIYVGYRTMCNCSGIETMYV